MRKDAVMTRHVATPIAGLIITAAITVGAAGTAAAATTVTSAGAPAVTTVSLDNTPWG